VNDRQRDPELDRLLAPLRDGPVALPGAEETAQQRERVVGALRSEVRRLPDRRRMRLLVRRSLQAVAGTLVLGAVLFVAPRVQHTATLHESARRAGMAELVWVVDAVDEPRGDAPRPVRSDEARSQERQRASEAPVARTTALPEADVLPGATSVAVPHERSTEAVTPIATEPRAKATRTSRSKRAHRHAVASASDAEKRLLADALRAERGTQRKRARILFARLLRSYPRSALAPEARAGLARVR